MKLLVGLGNPEKKYDGTYHNMGFFVVDKFAQKFGVEFGKKKHQALLGKLDLNGEEILIAKPQTYMNLSGNAVLEIKKKHPWAFMSMCPSAAANASTATFTP